MQITNKVGWTAVLTAGLALPLLAGGFWVQLGDPQADPEARAMNTALVFRLAGCMSPEKAAVTARAVNLAGGAAVPLKLTHLKDPGSYALTREWPANGKWAVEIIATAENGRVTSAVLSTNPDGVDRKNAKLQMTAPNETEVRALLAQK